MLRGSVLMSYAALGAAEFVRGVGLIALRAGTGAHPPRAQVLVSVGLSVLLILAGGPLAPQVAMLALSTILALAIRLEGATQAANG